MLNKYDKNTIRYTKASGETSERVIIPTYVPDHNVTSIDVTGLSEEEQNNILTMITEYGEYVEQFKSTMFSLSDWIEQTTGNKPPELKWRKFTVENIVSE